MWLHNVKFEDIKKLQGCYLISKEDHSVFVTPVFCADDEDAELPGGRQRFLDNDYAGFAFAPMDLMTPYTSNRDHVNLSGKLFCHMTNFVACHHGFHSGTPLVPSVYLHVANSSDQMELLNPTI